VLSPTVIALFLSLAAGASAPPSARGAVARPTLARAIASKGPARGAAKKRAPPKPRVIELVQVNTHETFKLRFADDRGRPVQGLQKRANHFFRCHHTQAQGRMHPRLLKLLFETGRHWPGQRLEVVSGFRHPTVAKNPHSPHMKGLACDFRVVGVKNTELRDYLRRAFNHIGVGYYPNSSFVHLDVRQGASGFWIDYSGPGENALYSDNAAEDLKSGRADTFRPAKIDPTWAETDEPVSPPTPDVGGATGQATAVAPVSPPAAVPGAPVAPPPMPAAADPQVQ
jgi:uncharacterized protein YcbK (DUF882 family)